MTCKSTYFKWSRRCFRGLCLHVRTRVPGEMRCPSSSGARLGARSSRDLSLCRCALRHGGSGGAAFCPRNTPSQQDSRLCRRMEEHLWWPCGSLSLRSWHRSPRAASSPNPPQPAHEPRSASPPLNCSFVLQALPNTVLFHVTVLFMEG